MARDAGQRGSAPPSLVQGPDGNLYIATDAGEIWRVVPN